VAKEKGISARQSNVPSTIGGCWANYSDIEKMLAVIAEVMQVELPSAPALEVYSRALEGIPIDKLRRGFEKVCRGLECYGRFPSLYAITTACGIPSLEDQQKAELGSAWDEALEFADHHVQRGEYGWHPETEREKQLPERTRRVVRRLGGWSTICTARPRDMSFIRKDFFELYRQAAAEDLVEEWPFDEEN